MSKDIEFHGSKFTVIYEGKTPIENLKVSFKNIQPNLSEEGNKIANDLWDKFEANLKSQGKPAYNGNIYQFLSFKEENGNLLIECGPTQYKYKQLEKSEEYKKIRKSSEYFPEIIRVNTFIKTADNKILLGRKEDSLKKIKPFKLPGGHLECGDPQNYEKDADILREAKTNINEEIGPLEIKNVKVIGLVSFSTTRGFVLCAETDLKENELIDFMEKNKEIAKDSYTMKDRYFVNLEKNQLEDFINKNEKDCEDIMSYLYCLEKFVE